MSLITALPCTVNPSGDVPRASKVGEPKENGKGYFALHFLTPETERTSHYHHTAARYGYRPETIKQENTRPYL